MDILRKEVVLRQCALYMIFLMLTLPLISSNALALSITGVTVSGSAGFEDIMQSQDDYFTATVTVSDEIDPNQLYISYTKNEAFDECTGTTCTYISSQTDRSGQEMDYTIQLINDSTVVYEVDGTILIDGEAPEIADFDVEKDDDDITISYEVEDTACDDCEGCAGIDYIYLYDNEVLISDINVASLCEVEDEIETTVTGLNLADGEHEICIQAIDNVGYESDQSCQAIEVDTEGPHFETGTVSVTDAGSGLDVLYVGANYILVDIAVNVSDVSLSENTVRADLSSLNGVIGDTYENVSADDCTEVEEGLWSCVWDSYYVESISSSPSLTFYAYDNEGNEGTYTTTYALTVDESAPSVFTVYTETSTGDDMYLSSGANSLYADFDPTGSAFAYEQAYLTLSAASLNNDQADDCWDAGSYWTCVWNISVGGSSTATTLEIDATDDAGNSMETYDLRVIIDDEEPEIRGIDVSLECPTSSDVLYVTINATDDISEEVFVRFYGEDIRTDDDPIIEECDEYSDGAFTCLFSVDDFVSYATDEDVLVEVVDLAGNIAEEEIDIEVCELEEAGEPNFVELTVDEGGPLDRLTLSYINVPVYIPIEFDISSYASIVSKTVSCSGTSGVYFVDEDRDTTLMVMYVDQQVPETVLDTLYVDCTMQLTMQYGDKVYMNPEIEAFDVAIELYGAPLGFIDEGIQAKIDAQIAGIGDAERRIKNWVRWNSLFGFICKIVDLWTKANAVFGVVHFVAAIAIKSGVATGLAVAVENAANTFDGITLEFVWFPGYGGWTTLGSYMKWACFIYSGKLCEGFHGLENDIILPLANQDAPGEAGSKTYYRQNDQVAKTSGVLKGTMFADWDPYRSIHTARSCLYMDALIYNLRKDRQINCMYTTCLENAATNGLDTYLCEVQYDQRECLYVDGAAWRAMGPTPDVLHFFRLVLNTFLSNIDWWAYSTAYYSACGPYIASQIKSFNTLSFLDISGDFVDSLPGAEIYRATCHVMGAAVSVAEYGLTPVDFDFKAELEGTDYCVAYNGVETEEEKEEE